VKRAVVLFTRDLRVYDHAALSAAIEMASEIVPLFVLDDALWHQHRSPARRAFLLDSLAHLRLALRERGGDLVIRRGDSVEETLRVAHRVAASVVFVGADASTYAQRRQERFARICRRERIDLRVENRIGGAVPAGELVPADRDHYRGFTRYWRRWRDRPLPAPLDPPRGVSLPPGIDPSDLPSARPGLRGGEREARRRLDAWLWIEDEDALTAWAEGRTGYPIVDAAMRQLRAEGWMHNRGRLLVASFLTKTLGIDWRRGAKLFLELLVDGDVANNAGDWQWVAGTGVDSRPNRVFNPIAQAKRLDPLGEYVRTHVPELGELKGSTIHEPWRAPLAARAPEYPEQIVDLEQRAARA
jgi:deoxyribodipyrimidine photolyase